MHRSNTGRGTRYIAASVGRTFFAGAHLPVSHLLTTVWLSIKAAATPSCVKETLRRRSLNVIFSLPLLKIS